MSNFCLLGLSEAELKILYGLFTLFQKELNDEKKIYGAFAKVFQLHSDSVLLHYLLGDVKGPHLCFEEFVTLIWSFSIRSESSIASFTFDAFDMDKSNTLSLHELESLVRHTFGGRNINRKLKFVLNGLCCNSTGEVTRADFLYSLHNCYAFLFPAIDMQRKIRETVLGIRVWSEKEMSATMCLRNPAVLKLVANVTSSRIHLLKSDEVELLALSIACVNGTGSTKMRCRSTSLDTVSEVGTEDSVDLSNVTTPSNYDSATSFYRM